jgi:hypothetical protein
MRMFSATLAVALGACIPAPPEGAPPPPSEGAPTPLQGQCDADRAVGLVGREATAERVAEAQRLSGARRLRVIRPGQAVTMDYNSGRLNVHVDTQNRVERLACG